MTSSGTVSAPQLFASNTLIVTNTSDFSDDLFLTKNWAGWSKLQVSNNSAASDSGPELRLLGNQSARVFLERDGGTHHHDQRRGSGADEEPAALRLRGGQAVQAPGHERGPEAGLRLGRLRRNKVEEFDGDHAVERRHGDGHPRLLSPHQRALGGVQGLPGPAGRRGSLAGPAGAEESIRNMADARRRTIKAVYEDPRTGFGSIAQTLQQAQVRDPSISREEVKAFLDGLRVNQDPQRGYSFVPLEPMNQLQVDLADMKAFGGKPYPFMLVAIDALTKKVGAEPLKDRLASTTAAGMKKVFQALGVPANVYSDDGSEFKREFKELMDFWDIKEAMLRRIAAGAGRRGQWHLMLADILSQINGRKHATTQVAPNLAYSDPEMAEIALRNIERRAKHKVTRPEIKVGDMVRIRVKPIESRGSYRVNEIAWSEKVYRVVSAESGEMGLEGWPEKVVHRDLRKVPENSAPEPRGLEVQSRQRRLQRGPRLPPPF